MTVPVWSCGQFPFHFSLSVFFFFFSFYLTCSAAAFFYHAFLYQQPILLLRPYSLFCFIFFTPARSVSQPSLSPQVISHSITFTSCSTKCFISTSAFIFISCISSCVFFFSIFSCLPHFVSSSRCSFSYSFFFIHFSFPFVSNLVYHLNQIIFSLFPFVHCHEISV